jgi:hypothetical protein
MKISSNGSPIPHPPFDVSSRITKRTAADYEVDGAKSSRPTADKKAKLFEVDAISKDNPSAARSISNSTLDGQKTRSEAPSNRDVRSMDAKQLYLEELKRVDDRIAADRAVRVAQIGASAERPCKEKNKILRFQEKTINLAEFLKTLPDPDPNVSRITPVRTSFPPLDSFIPPRDL